MTNYQLSKLVNYRLDELGMDSIEPQQLYGARKSKLFVKEFGTADLTDRNEILRFIDMYVANRKNGVRSVSVNPAEWFAANS